MLLQLLILGSASGVCLFSKIWKWNGTCDIQGTCKLVLTFFKLSRDIGEAGHVDHVLFGSNPGALQTAASQAHDHGTSAGPVAGIRARMVKRSEFQGKPTHVKMLCHRGSSFLVAAFVQHMDKNEDVRAYLEAVAESFEARCRDTLQSLDPDISAIEHEAEDSDALRRHVLEKLMFFHDALGAVDERFPDLVTSDNTLASSRGGSCTSLPVATEDEYESNF